MKALKKIIFVIVLLLIPILVKAYDIEDYYVKAILQNNGDLVVEEYYNMNGDYNGSIHQINYRNSNNYDFDPTLEYYGTSKLYNASDVEILEVRGVDVNRNFDFKEINGEKFSLVENASKGDYGVYTNESTDDGYNLMIYMPDYYNKAFYIKYIIKNLAVLHNDVGELYWQLITADNTESMGNVRVQIEFPNNKNELRVWAHGPLNGEVRKDGKNTLLASLDGLDYYTSIDLRATFDKAVISKANKKSNVNALDKILKYEESKANQANYERKQRDKLRQKEAKEEIDYCFENVYRSCYERAFDLVDSILDTEVKKEYKTLLVKLKEMVVEKEETTAKNNVLYAESHLLYVNYEEALKSVDILENVTLKNELNKRLDVVKEKIIFSENKRNNNIKKVSIFLIMVVIFIIITIYFKLDKEYTPEFQEMYLRDFPNDYSPSTVAYLFKNKITNEAISAEILNLIDKKMITYKKDENNKKNYIFKRNTSEIVTNPKETAILNLLFNGGNQASLKELKKRAKTHYSSFIRKWENVKTCALSEARQKKIYVDDKDNYPNKKTSLIVKIFNIISFMLICTIIFAPIGIMILVLTNLIDYLIQTIKLKDGFRKSKNYAVLSFILIMCITLGMGINLVILNHWVHSSIKYALLIILLCIVGIIYVSVIKKRTLEGTESYAKWKAFKNFLKHFGTMDIKELPDVELWQKYLVYATVLGCAKKLSKQMGIKLNEMNLNTNDFDIMDFYYLNSMSRMLSRTMQSSHAAAVSAKRAAESSSGGSWSSGSGGGGGFSSGGGGGGGGGSFGRF